MMAKKVLLLIKVLLKCITQESTFMTKQYLSESDT